MDETQTEFGLSYVIKQLQQDIRALKLACESGAIERRDFEKDLLKLRADLVSLDKELARHVLEISSERNKRGDLKSHLARDFFWGAIVIIALAVKEVYDHIIIQ